ncbi:Uncharacterized protein FKW44_023149 [Caligus rogercresseyi]|uniref:Uncharacterized protein n=1 Tax=Caligus rogercresseyi TaxID=217165 RepID=A0A7T8GPD9_CALRO|nr:Uncharacterized protein FKW44_023149 [Caligus rogercresseyi]
MFTVNQTFNHRNDRFVVPKTKRPLLCDHKASRGSHGAWGRGVRRPEDASTFFSPGGLKINTEEYLKVLRRVVLPWIKATYLGQDVVWQQDSAPPTGE